MSDTQEPPTPEETFNAHFDTAWNRSMGGAEEPAEEENRAEESGGFSGNPLDAASDNVQDAGVENPGVFDPKSMATAYDEIHRAGLDSLLAGKGEAEILAFGKELGVARAQRDREFSARQTQKPAHGGNLGAAVDPVDAEAPDCDGASAEAGSSAELPDFTPLVEEFGEDAARPIIDAIEALSRDNAALRSRFEAQEQERQLAPVLKQAEMILDGLVRSHQDLSKPESREKVIVAANKLALAYPEKYGALPIGEERLSAILKDAALLELGPATSSEKPATPRRKAQAPAGNSNRTTTPKGSTLNDGFDRAWEKNFGRGT